MYDKIFRVGFAQNDQILDRGTGLKMRKQIVDVERLLQMAVMSMNLC